MTSIENGKKNLINTQNVAHSQCLTNLSCAVVEQIPNKHSEAPNILEMTSDREKWLIEMENYEEE